MREIKYRVWDKTNAIWMDYDEIYIDQEGVVYLIEERTWSYQTYMHKEDISDKVEIYWYTGLKDVNGKEIYEGDIIKDNLSSLGIVKFINGSYRLSSDYQGLSIQVFSDADFLNEDLINDNNLAIFGNVYENPETMKNRA